MDEGDRLITNEELKRLFTGTISYGSCVAFYLDANIDQSVMMEMRERGVAVISVYQQGQRQALDTHILSHARETGRVLVSHNKDFEAIHERLRRIEGTTHAGIILVGGDRAPSYVAAMLIRWAEKYEDMPDMLQNAIFTL